MIDAVDQPFEIIEIAVIPHALEIERGQRHHTGTAKFDSMARQGNGFGKVAQAGSRDDHLRIDTGGDKAFQRGHTLGTADGQRFAGGTERGQAGTSCFQKLGGKIIVETLIERKIVVEWREDRRDQPLDHGKPLSDGPGPRRPYQCLVEYHRSRRAASCKSSYSGGIVDRP